ncbi:hypothetical protein PLESTB_000060800 [Pleodorina starrii]|uniref:Uncharacterized protein n=1 Tax=Pleodorina starrii TaxID=330485 RepID=A0A9W6B9P2_9CHLO|nr:hypothetical protein PLESTB_000060800 [Pleodorina starrii]
MDGGGRRLGGVGGGGVGDCRRDTFSRGLLGGSEMLPGGAPSSGGDGGGGIGGDGRGGTGAGDGAGGSGGDGTGGSGTGGTGGGRGGAGAGGRGGRQPNSSGCVAESYRTFTPQALPSSCNVALQRMPPSTRSAVATTVRCAKLAAMVWASSRLAAVPTTAICPLRDPSSKHWKPRPGSICEVKVHRRLTVDTSWLQLLADVQFAGRAALMIRPQGPAPGGKGGRGGGDGSGGGGAAGAAGGGKGGDGAGSGGGGLQRSWERKKAQGVPAVGGRTETVGLAVHTAMTCTASEPAMGPR